MPDLGFLVDHDDEDEPPLAPKDDPEEGEMGADDARGYKLLESQASSLAGSTLSKAWAVGFVVEITLFTLVVYYMDVLLDYKALTRFWAMDEMIMFSFNGLAILVSAVLTLFELVRMDESFPMPRNRVLFIGLAFPVQLHVAYLVYLSILHGAMHPVLVKVKFSEASFEAVTSATIQLYSIISCDPLLPGHTCAIEGENLDWMVTSGCFSMLSISIAFSMFDMRNLSASGFPGLVTGKLTWAYLWILSFRLAEVSSRLVSYALLFFLCPFSVGFTILGLEILFLGCAALWFGGQIRWFLGCMCALVNPLLETENVLTIPHQLYYGFRICSLVAMYGAALLFCRHEQPAVELLLEVERVNSVCRCWLAATLYWMGSLPFVRAAAQPTMRSYTQQWVETAFTPVQERVRDQMCQGDPMLRLAWLKPLDTEICALEDIVEKVQEVSVHTDEEAELDVEIVVVVNRMLNAAYNTPLTLVLNDSDGTDEIAGKLETRMWRALNQAMNASSAVSTAFVSNGVGCGLLARYVRLSLARFNEAVDEGEITSFGPLGEEEEDAHRVLDEEGHPYVEVDSGLDDVDCHNCHEVTPDMWVCFACHHALCSSCYKELAKKEHEHVRMLKSGSAAAEEHLLRDYTEPVHVGFSPECSSRSSCCQSVEPLIRTVDMKLEALPNPEVQVQVCMSLINGVLKGSAGLGVQKLAGTARDPGKVLQCLLKHLSQLEVSSFDTESLRRDPRLLAAVEMVLPLILGRRCPRLTEIKDRAKLEFYQKLLSYQPSALCPALPWFPSSTGVGEQRAPREVAIIVLGNYYTKAQATASEVDDYIVLDKLIEFCTTISSCSPLMGMVKDLTKQVATAAANQPDERTQSKGKALLALLAEDFNTAPQENPSPEVRLRLTLRVLRSSSREFTKRVDRRGKGTDLMMSVLSQKSSADLLVLFDLAGQVLRPGQHGAVPLAALVLREIRVWATFKPFVFHLCARKDGMLDDLLNTCILGIRLALAADTSGCDVVLLQVLRLLPDLHKSATPSVWAIIMGKLTAANLPVVGSLRTSVRKLAAMMVLDQPIAKFDEALERSIDRDDLPMVWTLLPEADLRTDTVVEKVLRCALQKMSYLGPATEEPDTPRHSKARHCLGSVVLSKLGKCKKQHLTPLGPKLHQLHQLLEKGPVTDAHLHYAATKVLRKIKPIGVQLHSVENIRFQTYNSDSPQEQQTVGEVIGSGMLVLCLFESSHIMLEENRLQRAKMQQMVEKANQESLSLLNLDVDLADSSSSPTGRGAWQEFLQSTSGKTITHGAFLHRQPAELADLDVRHLPHVAIIANGGLVIANGIDPVEIVEAMVDCRQVNRARLAFHAPRLLTSMVPMLMHHDLHHDVQLAPH